MNEGSEIIRQNSIEKKTRRFLQPLAVTVMAAVFAALILSLGILYLERLDNALVGFMEARGLVIVGTVEKVAQENMNYLHRSLRKEPGGNSFVPLTNEAFSPQESLIRGLVNIARDIDVKWKTTDLSNEELKKIAERENLWLIAALDKQGRIVFQSKEFPENTSSRKPPVTSKHEEILIDLFNRFGKLHEIGYIALRRKDGSGTIIIALDNVELRHWSARIATEKAIEEIGSWQGLAYLRVTDGNKRVLGQAGDVPEEPGDAGSFTKSIMAGKTNIKSRKITFQGNNIIEIITPVHLDGKVAGFARLGLDRDRSDVILKENRYGMLIATTFIVILGILSMWILYRNQNRHLARMEEMRAKLHRAERLSALGQLAAGVAHEIRNPLNAISLATQRAQREYLSNDEEKKKGFRHITGVIRDEIKRLNDIIEEFLTFSKSRRLELHNHSIVEIMRKVTNLMEEEAQYRGITIKTSWSDNNIMVSMDENKMKQAIYNVLKNAMESISGKGAISVSVMPDREDKVKITITDTGLGLTHEEIDRIFNPEYTTKEKGLGLGLSLTHEIIRGHRGEINVRSETGSGTTFEILLPVEK
jgi:signal transduction histidine kinase